MMHKIIIEEKELPSRVRSVSKLLRPICRDSRNGPASNFSNPLSSKHLMRTIGAHDGNNNLDNVRDWRFFTHNRNYRGNYFETWAKVPQTKDKWYLLLAYLHIYRRSDDVGILALHVDPNEGATAAHCDYKRSPHIHLLYPETLFPNAHIALNKLDLDNILQNIDTLELALKSGISLIVEEMIT